MKAVAFAPLHNSPGKHDATGAFQPEAKKWLRAIGVEPDALYLVDCSLPFVLRKKRVLDVLASYQQDIEVAGFFCHGAKSQLQVGFNLASVPALASSLARFPPLAHVVLYACDAARDADADKRDETAEGPGGDGGFADLLRDNLVGVHGRSTTVWAHSTVGHATMNPYVRRFDPSKLNGGEWVIDPTDPRWRKWRRALRETDLRFHFWSLTQDELHAELSTFR